MSIELRKWKSFHWNREDLIISFASFIVLAKAVNRNVVSGKPSKKALFCTQPARVLSIRVSAM